MKLFGGRHGARMGCGTVSHRNYFKPLVMILALIAAAECLYFTAVYSQNSFIKKWRNVYITTAMDTLHHQWLATAIIPRPIIDEVIGRREASIEAQQSLESTWTPPEAPLRAESTVQEVQVDVSVVTDAQAQETAQRTDFYQVFYDVDPVSLEAYLEQNPQLLDHGWNRLVIDQSGLDQHGTEIKTIYGEQVLAIDVPNQILLIRVEGDGYRGILAVAKDPSRLSLQESSMLGTSGQTVAEIASRTGGVLAMTGSGFLDPNGGGNGGILAGYAMCHGVSYGSHATRPGDKRLELHEDNLMYIYDTSSPVGKTCTDAAEWQPAIIIDGKDVLGYGWDGLHPRACIGQSSRYEIMMLIVEGRAPLKGILGITLYDCADILLQHGCMQAMNLDGGTSAVLWYNGRTVTNCSNARLTDGRPLPSAFVYGAAS